MSHVIEESLRGVEAGGDFRCIDDDLLLSLHCFLIVNELFGHWHRIEVFKVTVGLNCANVFWSEHYKVNLNFLTLEEPFSIEILKLAISECLSRDAAMHARLNHFL